MQTDISTDETTHLEPPHEESFELKIVDCGTNYQTEPTAPSCMSCFCGSGCFCGS